MTVDNDSPSIEETLKVAEGLLPNLDGNEKKEVYLSYRLSGFGVREACQAAGVTYGTILNWRRIDPKFKQIDSEGLTEARKTLGAQYAALEFMRNFRLVLKMDFDIIKAALFDIDNLSNAQKSYLIKMRSHYTPQQLQALRDILVGKSPEKIQNFSTLVMQITQQAANGHALEPAVPGELIESKPLYTIDELKAAFNESEEVTIERGAIQDGSSGEAGQNRNIADRHEE